MNSALCVRLHPTHGEHGVSVWLRSAFVDRGRRGWNTSRHFCCFNSVHSCVRTYFEGPTLENRGFLVVQSAIHNSGGELPGVMVFVRSEVVKYAGLRDGDAPDNSGTVATTMPLTTRRPSHRWHSVVVALNRPDTRAGTYDMGLDPIFLKLCLSMFFHVAPRTKAEVRGTRLPIRRPLIPTR